MDSNVNPFSGTRIPDSYINFISSKAASRNEAAIVGGVMIGSVLFVALVGVACMFYKERARKNKLREAKTATAGDYV
ncbi:hypothetical protein FSARC_9215 [Fusarium sarcochroum]|uniref:Uncharacterized protein n=1 Tax=Fusarium sarcochroum TaxID=1208366 RepID=A0A8H4TRR3_9HYPO|nr:hypothetical protein FSARC_9215 [Fusarium sarcochroum]